MVELRRLTNIIFLSLAKKHFDRDSRIEAYPHLLVQTHILVSYSSSLILLPSPFISLFFFSNMYSTWKRVQLWHRSRDLLATQCFCSGKNKEKSKQTIRLEINFNSYLLPSLGFITLKVQTLVTYSLF